MELRQRPSEPVYKDEKWKGCRLRGKLIGLWMRSVKGADRMIGRAGGGVGLEAGMLFQQTRISSFGIR